MLFFDFVEGTASDLVTEHTLPVSLEGNVALIVIDMQYATACRTTGKGRLLTELGRTEEGKYRFDRIENIVVPNIRRLLEFFREYNMPRVFVKLGSQHSDCSDLIPQLRRAASAYGNIVGRREHEILDELAPESSEPVITKLSVSAFTDSTFLAALRNLQVETLVFTGVSTSQCVDLTARDAADRGYRCVIVEDAVAEDSEEHHLATLRQFQRTFGRVATANELLWELREGGGSGEGGGREPAPQGYGTVATAGVANHVHKAKPARRPAGEHFGALRGLRIIDAGTMIGGPFAATLAADYGADVIKIEKPRVGDPLRTWLPTKNGVSLWWKASARNKRLVTLDLRSEGGRELFLRLIEGADAVIENYRPGTFARWGLAYPQLTAVNPHLILVHVSGYGQTGPYAHRPGYGTVGEAMSGIPAFTGFPENPPTFSAFPLADTVAAVFALLGLLSAVYERDVSRTGRGQEVDCSLYEPLFRLAEQQVIGYDQLGIVKERRGNGPIGSAPRNAYQSSDQRWIAISVSSEATFARFATAIGRPDLLRDPRFTNNSQRVANQNALDEIISAWMRTRLAAEIMTICDEHGVVAGPVYDIHDIFDDQQYLARENIVTVEDRELGPVKMQGVIPKFSRTPGRVRCTGGVLGEHNWEVYSDLGIGESEFADLQRRGVV